MAEDQAPLMSESASTSQGNMSVISENESKVSKALAKFVESVVEEMERKIRKYEMIAQPGGRPILSNTWNLSKYASKILFGATAGTAAFAEGKNYSSAASQAGQLGEIFGEKYLKGFRGIGQREKTKLVTFALGNYILDTIKLRELVCQAAGRVFQAFEYQILQINKLDTRVYQKLAYIVVNRMLWSLTKCGESIKTDEDMVRTLSIGAVYCNFEAKGSKINSEHKREWHAGSMFSKSGIYDGSNLYANKNCKTDKYGYRLPLIGEQYEDQYGKDKKPVPFNYSYVLTSDLLETYVLGIFNKINDQDPIVAAQKIKENAAEILSDATESQENLKASIALLGNCSSDMDYKNSQLETLSELTQLGNEKIEPLKSNLKVLSENQDKSLSYIAAIKKVQQKSLPATEEMSKNVAEAQKSLKIIEESQISKSIFCIGHPTENFVGRAVELEEIKRYFDNGRKCVVISGEDGVGKAELARKFAAENYNRDMFNGLWFDAYDIIGLKDSIYLRAREMNVRIYKLYEHNEEERSVLEIASDVYRKTENRKTLLIFNDVRNYTVLRNFLPWRLVPDMENIQVLITTRNASLITEREIKLPVIELKTFKQVKMCLDNNYGSQREIIALSLLLNYNPLALSLAVGYLKTTESTIRNYAPKLKERKDGREWSFEDMIRETVLITLSAIEEDMNIGGMALDLLKIMTCLSPEFILSERFFDGYVDSPNQLAEALDLLKKFALIRLDGKTVSVHRKIQAVLQQWLSESRERESYLESVLDLQFLWNYNNLLEHFVPASHTVKFLEAASDFEAVTLNFFKRDENISLLVLEYLAQGDLNNVVRNIFEHLKKQPDIFWKYRKYTLGIATKLGSINVIKSLEPDNLRWIYFLKVLRAWKLGEIDALRTFLKDMEEDRCDFINRPMEDLRQSVLIETISFYTDDIRNEIDGKPPLILAISLNNSKLLEVLVGAGADVAVTFERVGENRKSALYVAVEKNLPDIVRYLLQNGCVVENDETYPFHLAAGKGLAEIVDIFLDHTTDTNIRNNIGQTPLHLAAMSGHLQIIQNLINKGADVTSRDDDGRVAVYYAMLNEENDVREYLENLHDPEDIMV